MYENPKYHIKILIFGIIGLLGFLLLVSSTDLKFPNKTINPWTKIEKY